MEEAAARKPGQYFVFCSFDQTILAFIDNSLDAGNLKKISQSNLQPIL